MDMILRFSTLKLLKNSNNVPDLTPKKQFVDLFYYLCSEMVLTVLLDILSDNNKH